MKKNKLIINLAPTGMVPFKKDNPNVPIQPNEIADQVLECSKLGVSMVHLHARDKKGIPSTEKNIYSEIIKKIRKYNKDIVIITSTSGRKKKDFESRTDVLNLKKQLKPDMASLTMSSLNFKNQESLNSPEMIIKIIKKMNKKNIKPEIEIFDIGMLNFTNYLIKKKLLTPPFFINIILGNIASAQFDFVTLGNLLTNVPKHSIVSFGGIGKSQIQSTLAALTMPGIKSIRIGLEDNLKNYNNNKLLSNYELVNQINEICKILDIQIVYPKELRKILNLY